jgi:glucose uptake protein GlcU
VTTKPALTVVRKAPRSTSVVVSAVAGLGWRCSYCGTLAAFTLSGVARVMGKASGKPVVHLCFSCADDAGKRLVNK